MDLAAFLPPFEAQGIDGTSIYVIETKELVALVHDCSTVPYESDDLSTVHRWIEAHNRVLMEAMDKFDCILPFAFNTIIKADHREASQVVKKWLEENEEHLRIRLRQVRGRQEFGIQLMWNRARISASLTENDAEIRKIQDDLDNKPKGMAYLLKQKIDHLVRRIIQQHSEDTFELIHQAIKNSVAEVKIGSNRRGKSDGEWEIIANITCLASTAQWNQIRNRLKELDLADGFSVRLCGPFPPYSFV